jgi:hypothetical protein
VRDRYCSKEGQHAPCATMVAMCVVMFGCGSEFPTGTGGGGGGFGGSGGGFGTYRVRKTSKGKEPSNGNTQFSGGRVLFRCGRRALVAPG